MTSIHTERENLDPDANIGTVHVLPKARDPPKLGEGLEQFLPSASRGGRVALLDILILNF